MIINIELIRKQNSRIDKQSILIPKNLIADVQNKLSEYEKKIIENNRISKIELVEDLISELLEMTEKTKFTSVFSEQEKESAKLLSTCYCVICALRTPLYKHSDA